MLGTFENSISIIDVIIRTKNIQNVFVWVVQFYQCLSKVMLKLVSLYMTKDRQMSIHEQRGCFSCHFLAHVQDVNRSITRMRSF